MARARNIKPSFFTNEELVELPFEVRLLFIGLWTLADREGRLEDRPKRIKMAIFPADNVEVDIGLNLLQESGFILRYEAAGIRVIQVLNFSKHQNPHIREAASELPLPGQHCASTVQAQSQHCASHADSLNPYSLNPESGEQRASTPCTGVAREAPQPAALPAVDVEPIPNPEPTRRGIVCRLLRQAGIADAAPHQLPGETWERILGKRTDEEIVEFARAKLAAREGQRTGLRYLAPGLLDDPHPVSTGPPSGARASPHGAMSREESRRIAASTRLSDFRAACAAEQQEQTDDDGRTIDAAQTADTRLLG